MMSTKSQPRGERVLSFEDAQRLVLSHADGLRERDLRVEEVPILKSSGRTIAEDILADRDFPPFPRATRDGYAIRSGDVKSLPSLLTVVGQLRAGGSLPAGFVSLQAGETVSIMTGSPVPAGADAVVMVEHTERTDDRVRVLRSVAIGENIVPRGSEAKAGSCLVERGTRISHPHVALAASSGKAALKVFVQPTIAILPTGDEIVPVDSVPEDNQIRNSNSFSLAAQVIAAGGKPLQLPIAPDERGRLRELVRQGLESDLLLLSGGVSAGEYDFVEDVLAEFAAEFFFTGVQIQPGKPLVFGRARADRSREHGTYFFGLPGNPISTMVTFELFASIMVRALSGATAKSLMGMSARLAQELRVKTGLTRFLPAHLIGDLLDTKVEPVKWQGSGDIAAFARADCLLVVPPDRECFKSGEWMTVLPLKP